MKRIIYSVRIAPDDAATDVLHLREQKRRPRTYRRMARAENLALRVFVVCADIIQP
jgi:hypothetical protein